MSKISPSGEQAFLSSLLISVCESCTDLLVLLHYSCRHAVEKIGCIAHWLPPTVEHRGRKVWVNRWTLLEQPAPDSCLFSTPSVDEVSGNSPVATNSTKHSTGEYPSLKMCIVFPSALLKIKSTSQHEGYSFFLTPCSRKHKATSGKKASPLPLRVYQTAFYYSWTLSSSFECTS